MPFETPVIPAKAGIQSADSAFPKVCRVDSRFRGNDCGLQRPCRANDTSTRTRSLQVTTRPPHGVSIVRPQRINLSLRARKVLPALIAARQAGHTNAAPFCPGEE
jgi:hypothetical protein